MPAAERPSSAQGLSQFLVEHSRCDAGFDFQHPQGVGGGTVSIRCRGCGARYVHEVSDTLDLRPVSKAGLVEVEREIEFAPVAPVPSRTPLKPEPGTADARRKKPSAPRTAAEVKARNPRGKSDRSEGHALRDRLAVAALILFALLAIGLAVFRSMDSDDGTEAQPPRPAGPRFERRNVEGGSLVVPSAWHQASFRGGTVLGLPGASAGSVQVYARNTNDKDLKGVVSKAVGLAKSQVGRGRVGARRIRKAGGARAYEVTVRGKRARRQVLIVLTPSKRFVLLGGFSVTAPRPQRLAVSRALASFRPDPGEQPGSAQGT